ncbi:MAG: hypothetical protein WCX63_05855, partial [Methanoregula sp.]
FWVGWGLIGGWNGAGLNRGHRGGFEREIRGKSTVLAVVGYLLISNILVTVLDLFLRNTGSTGYFFEVDYCRYQALDLIGIVIRDRFPQARFIWYSLFFIMPSQKSCPMKFGAAVSTEELLIEIPYCGKNSSWFFNNYCAIISIAEELCTSPRTKAPKGTAAD